MEVSYSLRYQKSTLLNKLIVDKEGEIIIYEKGFRLKGKGGSDKGELINFGDIKEFYFKSEKVIFITFNKEKYILSESGTSFEQLLNDIYRARNEFLTDALFMKAGKLKSEFDCKFERLSKFGKIISKGKAKLKLYEGSLVVFPINQDAFSVNYNFVNSYEFDDMEYLMKVNTDDGNKVFFSNFGNDFEFVEEKMNELLGGLYETVVNTVLRRIFPEFRPAELLKMAYFMKDGKALSLKELRKIDKELVIAVENFMFSDPLFKEKMEFLTEQSDEYGIFYGISEDKTVKGSFVRWFMVAIPEKNIVAFSILPRWQEGVSENQNNGHDTFFFKIIMERGIPSDKLEDKIREIEQSLITLKFVKDPCYKDRKELRHSPYLYAIRKLPFLRILRKSFAGKASAANKDEWLKQAETAIDAAKMVL